MKRYIFLLVLIFLCLPITVCADSDYCAPPEDITTIIDHQGEWYNITFYQDDYECITCTEATWFGDVTCNFCDNPPDVSFVATPRCGNVPVSVQFNDTSTGNNITGWYWDFGDGNTSSEQNPMHVYEFTGVFTIEHSATNPVGTSWYNRSNYINVRPVGESCDAFVPIDDVSAEGDIIPLKASLLSIPFILTPLLCLAYIFRGKREENSIWGNVFASGIGLITSAIVVLWFIQGGVTSVPVTLENTSYEIPGTMTLAEAQAIQNNASTTVNIIGAGGNGMFIRSAAATAEASEGTRIVIRTHDIVIQQYQDIGVAILYALMGVVLVALLLWSLWEMYVQIMMRRSDELNQEA